LNDREDKGRIATMARVTHFHISAGAPEKLIPFYRELFGWQFEKTLAPSPTWMIKTGEAGQPGIDGILHTRSMDSRVVNTIEVQDIDDMISRIESGGGRVLQQTEIPQAGKLALFEDPEQNLFQLRQPGPS
jgi:predicted enzyme related to lactoylglutathione lyase